MYDELDALRQELKAQELARKNTLNMYERLEINERIKVLRHEILREINRLFAKIGAETDSNY
jgi:uncharacterized small protein (DUF1192 family)